MGPVLANAVFEADGTSAVVDVDGKLVGFWVTDDFAGAPGALMWSGSNDGVNFANIEFGVTENHYTAWTTAANTYYDLSYPSNPFTAYRYIKARSEGNFLPVPVENGGNIVFVIMGANNDNEVGPGCNAQPVVVVTVNVAPVVYEAGFAP
jgi:hypothetical protein